MPLGLPSEAASLLFLGALLVVAMLIARRPAPAPPARVVLAAGVALALQALHVAEEFAAGFHRIAPALLGLEGWSDVYFVWVNLGAIAAWCLAITAFAAGRANGLSSGLLWFLALASIGNAIWHPAASLAIGAYFPGTATAPFMALTGLWLARSLLGAGDRSAPPQTAQRLH